MEVNKIGMVSGTNSVLKMVQVNSVEKPIILFGKNVEHLGVLFEPEELGILSSYASVQDSVLIED